MSARTKSAAVRTELPVMLTSYEVARVLQVSPSTLCRWRQTGQGPRVTWLTPNCPRYAKDDVDAWLARMAA
ncbi:helix-turn-helix transcriptional regulator [Cellulomonas sp. NS3]|uniref:helix-turn-helix transcriptional regulator n=1 Tax=Cellulomonas sp. NS3 TaxID=2973977 RepID=UPI002162B03E|nr:helix-turn-helix domain-containing protein [Cellulomonas sp. NS3]